MSDWDEIRRLAADLQRAQLSGATQRLSERNCIEIVNKLVGAGLVEVFHTADGKEYLTPQQLQREIRDELMVSRGRISLVDLASALNVDFSHVEQQATNVVRQDGNRIHLVLGQVVDSNYLDTLCEQVNEGLQLSGTVSISTLTKEHDLPSEFLQEQVGKRLGGIIEGFRDAQDPRIILTPSYVQRNRAKIRGALSAITVPTSVQEIVNRFGIQEHLFFSLAEELIQTGRIKGSITGGKRAAKATFVPAAHARAQTRWVDDFMAQNGYVEYEAVSRLGISDPKTFLKKRFHDRKVHFLSACCIGEEMLDLTESSVEEAASSSAWVDARPLLPSSLSDEDVRQILATVIGRKSLSVEILAETVAVSNSLVDKVRLSLEELIPAKAKADLESRKFEAILSGGGGHADLTEEKVDKKEERRKKAASGKAGGGAQGRETKTKSTKKKGGNKRRGGDDDWGEDDDEDVGKGSAASKKKGGGGGAPAAAKIELMSRGELEAKIGAVSQLEDCPDEVFSELAARMHPTLTNKFREALFELHRSTTAASMHDRSKVHSELQERCNSAISHVRLFEKGLAHFDGQDRKALEKHLLKTQCSELANALFDFLNHDEDGGGSKRKEVTTVDDRVQVIKRVGKEEGEALLAIHKSLSGDDVSAFVSAMEDNAQAACDVFIRKSDKKKDRQMVFAHKHTLLEKLQACQDPALCLHLTLMVLFQTHFGSMLHASGKFVPIILAKLEPTLEQEEADFLKQFQDSVVKLCGLSDTDDADEKNRLGEELSGQLTKLREVAVSKKKRGNDDE